MGMVCQPNVYHVLVMYSFKQKAGGGLRFPATRSLTSQQSRSMPTTNEGSDEDHMLDVIYLRETPTITLLHIPGVVVAIVSQFHCGRQSDIAGASQSFCLTLQDNREKNRVMERNSHYTSLTQGHTSKSRQASHCNKVVHDLEGSTDSFPTLPYPVVPGVKATRRR